MLVNGFSVYVIKWNLFSTWMETFCKEDMAQWSRKVRKHSGSILTVTLIGALLCFAMAHLFLLATDEQDDLDRRRKEQLARNRHSQSSRKANQEDFETKQFSEIFGSKDRDRINDQDRRDLTNSNRELSSIYISKTKYFLPGIRAVHLDLKGAAPNLDFLKEIFSLIAQSGGNALIIEYEDMFPYWGMVANASALNSFTVEEIGQLLDMAEENGLEVIPLVQTFGHMEHVLKLGEFSYLREMAPFPQSICPSQLDSFTVIRTMLDQVLQLHPRVKYFHIGCDEVYQLGQCSKCKDRMRKSPNSPFNSRRRKNITLSDMQRLHIQQQQQQNQMSMETSTPRGLFLDHVKRIARYVKESYNIQPIIWDDMLRTMSVKELLASGISGLVEPMVWVYVEDIDHFVDGDTWRTYSAVFPHLWTASAFKGAFGERLFMPNLHRHYRNHLSWLEVMARESGPFGHGRPTKFRGMALTGWSRYDHFAVLCELLPVAVPSLVLNLVTVSTAATTSEVQRFRQVEKILQCFPSTDLSSVHTSSTPTTSIVRLSPLTLEQDPHQFELRRCRFPGNTAFGVVGTLHHFKGEVEALDTNSRETQGWLTAYNIRHNYSSPWRLTESVGNHAYLIKALKEYSKTASKALQPMFDNATVDEWIEQNIRPLQEKTEQLLQVVGKLTARKTWPRRPIP